MNEIKSFINKICIEMGVTRNPNDTTLEGVFAELDEDKSDDVSIEELQVFLKRIFILQRDEIRRVLQLQN